MKLKKERPSRIRNWLKTIGAFFVMQLIFIILDMNSWIPNFKEGGVGDRLSLIQSSLRNGSLLIKQSNLMY